MLEKTFHPAQRQFWENEVFKTSELADRFLHPRLVQSVTL